MGDGGVRQAPKSGPGSAGGASGNQTESISVRNTISVRNAERSCGDKTYADPLCRFSRGVGAGGHGSTFTKGWKFSFFRSSRHQLVVKEEERGRFSLSFSSPFSHLFLFFL